MSRPRFTPPQFTDQPAAEALARPAAFVAVPAISHAHRPAASTPSAWGLPPAAASVYQLAQQAALQQTREREFRRYLDRALFSASN